MLSPLPPGEGQGEGLISSIFTASDLVGRYHITGGETVWVDGPMARAVRNGAICYFNEVVEARKDTTVVIHPTTATYCPWKNSVKSSKPARNSAWRFPATPVTRACNLN